MHVLYVIDSLVAGGAERSLAAIAPHLVAAGVRLDVAVLKDTPGLQPELCAAGARVVQVGGNGRAAWAARLVRLVRSARPDIVHTTLFEADVAGRLAGLLTRVPIVTTLANDTYGQGHVHDPRLSSSRVRAAQAIDVLTARAVSRFHAVNAHVAEVMTRRLLIPRSKVDVVPRGRDPRVLGERTLQRRASVRTKLGVDAGALLVVAAARHEHQKGLDVLLRAFAQARHDWPEACLLVAGREGHATPELRALTAELRLDGSAMLLGERSDVADVVAASDVFALPSRWEGTAGALIEAMALEAPIVATDLPGVREVVADAAVLVEPESSSALAAGLDETFRDAEASRDRARRARSRFERTFRIEAVAGKMIGVYERALGRDA